MTNGQAEFHFEEYKQIRAEVIGLLGRIEQLFRYSILVSASVTAWLLTSTLGAYSANTACVKIPRDFAAYGWLISPAFVLVAGLMAGVTMLRVVQMGRYLRMLEHQLGRRHIGWESFMAHKSWVLTASMGAVWVLLLGLSVGAAVLAFPVASKADQICNSR